MLAPRHPIDVGAAPAVLRLPTLLSSLLSPGAHMAATPAGVVWVRPASEERCGALQSSLNGYIPAMRVFQHAFSDSPARLTVLFDAQGVGELHAAAAAEAHSLLFQACHAALRLPDAPVYPFVRPAPRATVLEWSRGALLVPRGTPLLTLLPERASAHEEGEGDAEWGPAAFLASVLTTMPAELEAQGHSLLSAAGTEAALESPLFARERARAAASGAGERGASIIRLCEEAPAIGGERGVRVPISAAETAATRLL